MKSAALTGIREIQIQQVAVPEVNKDEVLIRIKACGICGTDVHIFEGDKGAADNPLPITLGHEFSGIVERVGEDVTGIKTGERVCVDPNVLCGSCRYCKSGIGHFCENMIGIGTTQDGGFAEYCLVPASQVYKLADTVSFEEGAMAEPLACCVHGIDLCGIGAGDDVVVIGGGMIGLLMLQLAHISGAARTVLIEPVAEKRVQGEKMGATMCIDPITEDVPQVLTDAGITQVDCVIECVGRIATLKQAIEIAGKGAVVMMFGLTKPEEELPIQPYEIFRKELVLKASFINPYTMGRAVSLINERRVDVKSMIAEAITLEELADVLSDAARRSKGKIIVKH